MRELLAQTTKAFLQPISVFLNDDSVSEIMINGHKDIYIERKGKLQKTDVQFDDEEQLMAAVRNIAQFVGRPISPQQPIMDARLADGSRIHIAIPPCAHNGICLTIRKFARENLSVKDLIKFGSLDVDAAKFINLCVMMSKNIIVSGGTSSGKTTLLNVVSSLIPSDQRIVVIEDSSELQLQQDHVVRLETQAADPQGKGEVTMRDLLKASLRMRPDRIVIGEVRSGEAMDLLQAMNTGHSGSMSTVHANNPKLSLSRLETLALMSGLDLPLAAVRAQVAGAIEIIIQAARLKDGSRKVTHVTEVLGIDTQGNYQTADIFVFKIDKVDDKGQIVGHHTATGQIPSFLNAAQVQGYNLNKDLFNPK